MSERRLQRPIASKITYLRLMRTLLDTASKFKNGNNEISTSCAKSLAIIGALDSNKFNLKTIKDQVIIIHDFHDYKENADFLRHFMENRVIKTILGLKRSN